MKSIIAFTMQACFMFVWNVSAAQSNSNTYPSSIQHEWTLTGETDNKDFTIQVNPGSGLLVKIQAELTEGSLEARIFSPNGMKDGQLILEADGSGKSKSKSKSTNVDDGGHLIILKQKVNGRAKGNFDKQIDEPEAGIWKVNVHLSKAVGHFRLEVNPYSRQ